MKKYISAIVLLATVIAVANDFPESRPNQQQLEEARRKFKIPDSIKAEHQELHEKLEKATRLGGETGERAKAVAQVMAPHFEKEELIAMPPLSLLSQVSSGKITSEMKEVLPLTDQLKADLPQMLKEHKAIVAELEKLRSAAEREKKFKVVEFAEALQQHAKTEEEILYPAAILVGEMIKTKFPK